ncbi:molecular chaperone DnaK, partial [Microvirga sp. 3-52]|nr:molecular chaperone DnaK [Microvirga sp. 3-52]
LEENNFEDVSTKKTALEEIVQKLTMKLYEQAAAEAQAAEGAEGAGEAEDDVVDADFEEVDEDEKK